MNLYRFWMTNLKGEKFPFLIVAEAEIPNLSSKLLATVSRIERIP